jgi:predicted trehalose synthase
MSSGSLDPLLGRWLPRQRWFAGKGSLGAPVRSVAETTLEGARGEPVAVRVHLVEAAGALYQVPLTYHPAPVPELAEALVGIVNREGEGARWVYDGPHDPHYVQALLRLIAREGVSGGGVESGAIRLSGVLQPGGPAIDEAASSSVLRGEQSNTSIVVGADTPGALIVKVFRVVNAGDNPDVVVQSVLAAAGCTRVPQPAGWVEGCWGEGQRGHLAFAVEFLGGSEDAWRVATRAVATGASFAEPARDLGVATAEVHELLAAHLPTRPAVADVLGALADGLDRRVDWAIAQAPALAELAATSGLGEAARAAVDVVRHLGDSDSDTGTGGRLLQQVHGDYHLGQVLHAPGRGWVLLDFEGEPLRPLAERLEPDLALRDVAGMLRSFDYAAGHASLGRADDDPVVLAAQHWAQEAREAFLAGYAERSGHDLDRDAALLRALELDKALYEVVYETRNRPDWAPNPVRAVRRLLGGRPAETPD